MKSVVVMTGEEKKKAVKHLLTSAEVSGVGTIKVKQGRLYLFKKHKLEEFLKTCEESGQDSVILFLKDADSTSSSEPN